MPIGSVGQRLIGPVGNEAVGWGLNCGDIFAVGLLLTFGPGSDNSTSRDTHYRAIIVPSPTMSAITMIQSLPRTYLNTFPPSEQQSAGGRGGNHQPIHDGHIIITPVLHDEQSSFGAQIDGIDWSCPLPADDIEKVSTPDRRFASYITRLFQQAKMKTA